MEYLKAKVFPFIKGRVALYAILKAMDVRPGDEIILPGFTCVVVPNAIAYVKAKPVYVDIDPENYNIDPVKIEGAVTPRTRAIIVQHTFGIPADMGRIVNIAKKHSLFLIEDACHSLGSTYDGRPAGAWGDAAFFSSQWSKPVTTGLGGWAVMHHEGLLRNMEALYGEFDNPALHASLVMRLQYAAHSLLFKPSLFWLLQGAYRRLTSLGLAIGSSGKDELDGIMPDGYKKVMSPWQRNLLERKLSDCSSAIHHRKEIGAFYSHEMEEKDNRRACPRAETVFLRYPVLVRDKTAVLEEAKKKRLELGDWFLSPVHPNLEGWVKAGYRQGSCPESEKICSHVVNLPTHDRITRHKAEEIVQFVADKRISMAE